MIRHGEQGGYVGECLELAIVTQGVTLDETVRNLQEATMPHLEGEDLASLGVNEYFTLLLRIDIGFYPPYFLASAL